MPGILQAQMSTFNDSTSMWTKAKEVHENAMDKVMQRDWLQMTRGPHALAPRHTSLVRCITSSHHTTCCSSGRGAAS